jgi:hypothetical protein
MSVEIEFPIEVMVPVVPLSQQASTRSKEEWKERIRTAPSPRLAETIEAEGPRVYLQVDVSVAGEVK